MAIYYVDVAGSAGNSGTSVLPWSLARAFDGSQSTPVAGDEVRIRPGTYINAPTAGGYNFQITKSGTSGNPIRYVPDPATSGNIIIDGATTAVMGAAVATPITGWTQLTGGISYSADGRDAEHVYSSSGAATGDPLPTVGGNRVYCWRHTVGGGILANMYTSGVDKGGLYAQDFTGLNARYSILANMGLNSPVRVANPDLRIHNTDYRHDTTDGPAFTSRPKHAWEAMWVQNTGSHGTRDGSNSVDLRLWDTTSPNTANIYASIKRTGIYATGITGILIDGDPTNTGTRRIHIYRHGYNVEMIQVTAVTIKNCVLKWGATSGLQFDQATNCVLKNNLVQGAGSWIYHDGSGLWLISNGCTVEDNTVEHAAHECIQVGGSPYSYNAVNNVYRRNTVHSEFGHGFNIARAGARSSLFEDNICKDTGNPSKILVHMTPHPGFQIQECWDTVFRRNQIIRCGRGFALGEGAPGNCRMYHNTVNGSEFDGIYIDQWTATANGKVYSNVFENNIIANSGAFGLSMGLFYNASLSADPWYANKFKNNDFYTPLKGDGKQVKTLSYSGPDGTKIRTVTEIQAAFAGNFSGNQSADPLFVNAGGDDLRINTSPVSPCINAGANDVSGLSLGSYPYPDRPFVGAAPDEGYYETGTGGSVNQKPVCSIAAVPTNGDIPLIVNFQGTASDPDGTVATHAWNFGDGTTSAVEDPGNHTYTVAGTYGVTYQVTDNQGATSDVATVTITARIPQVGGDPQIAVDASGMSASSFHTDGSGGFPAGNLVDGAFVSSATNNQGYWASNHKARFPHVLTMDVTRQEGRLKRISRTRFSPVGWNAGSPVIYTFNLDVSRDGTSWTSLIIAGVTNGIEWYDTTFPSALDLRYLRLTLTGNNQPAGSEAANVAEIWEWEIYGIDVPLGDAGNPWPIVATRDEAGFTQASDVDYSPATLFDGLGPSALDPTSRWVGGPMPEYFEIDLGQARTVGAVRLAPYDADRGRTYTLELAYATVANPTSGDYTIVPGRSAVVTSPNNVWAQIVFDAPLTMRWLRVRWLSSPETACASCYEIEAARTPF